MSTLQDQIKSTMQGKTTDELLAIWRANDRSAYSPDAFAAIAEVLRERAVDLSAQLQWEPATPPLTAAPADSRYKGVRGWLLLFCLGLTVLSPLFTLGTLVWGYAQSSEYFDQFPGLLKVSVIDTVLSVGLMAFSIYAGIGLWTIRPGAVRMAKRYLLCFLGYQVIGAILPFLAGLPSAANDAMIAEVAKDAFRSVIYFAIWYSYLNKSKRVRATYNL